ncbi:MAG: fumarylacetoacetate hydrolase family protein [Proteobacteria bacterium]|nr:fumarylacetoacetate hydrolase family protein [Pseudomonadota bacterium]
MFDRKCWIIGLRPLFLARLLVELISFLSTGTTLLPGTVILTGTPSGVGYTRKPPVFLMPGDTVDMTVEGIGTLSNPVELHKLDT